LLTRGVFGGFGCPVQAGMVQTYPPMICVIPAGTTVFSFLNQFAEKSFFMRANGKKDKKTFRTAVTPAENDTEGQRVISRSQNDCVTL
jgi:hypothetical protein